ncbi:hypothetical protein X738_30025 [Mesorhizobium sp. LNHC209A00]|nr:hypothetical protein X738_30025 [Mesorhizobium sp. LNHC209A00]
MAAPLRQCAAQHFSADAFDFFRIPIILQRSLRAAFGIPFQRDIDTAKLSTALCAYMRVDPGEQAKAVNG